MQRNGADGRVIHAVLPLVLLFLLIVFDQLTKCYFHQYDPEGNRAAIAVIDGFLYWDVSYNTGAGFSFLQGQPWAQTLFIILTVIALAVVYVYYLSIGGKYRFVKYGLMVLTAGILGNFIDRLAFAKVVDFISVKLWYGYFPTFNVADAAITVGVIMFIVHLLFLDADCLFCSKARRERRKARIGAEQAGMTAERGESAAEKAEGKGAAESSGTDRHDGE